MIWTEDVEAEVHALFGRVFMGELECIQDLLKLGLTKRQVENGLVAGGMQLSIDNGLTAETRRIFNEFYSKYPEDGAIVMRSLVFEPNQIQNGSKEAV